MAKSELLKPENANDEELKSIIKETEKEIGLLEESLEDTGIEHLEGFLERANTFLMRIREYASPDGRNKTEE